VELLAQFGLKAIVLAHMPDRGETVIEKFEHYASDVEFAIILLTPDDKNANLLPVTERFRARQNVIFEMGWFFAKRGRNKTLLLHKGQIELPSDVTGILYKKFNKTPFEVADAIRAALEEGGVRLRRTPKPVVRRTSGLRSNRRR
jgi:predicted nucleotide-binding protein